MYIGKRYLHPRTEVPIVHFRHVAKSKNLGGQVVMRQAAVARRRLLTFQNLGDSCPPAPCFRQACTSIQSF